MPALELSIAHLVAGLAQFGHEPAATGMDRQHAVARAVGEEQAGATAAPCRRRKPGREGENVREQVAVGQAEGERVGSPVREPADGQPGGIHGQALEDFGQGPVDPGDVWPVAAE